MGRIRPYDTLHGVEVLVPRANDFTFPSDHAVAAGAAICGLLLARRWVLGGVAVAVGLFLAFARVYVGAHYPGDVVAGYLMASVVVLVVSLLRPVAYRAVDVIEPTVLGALVRRPEPAAV